MPMNEEIDHHLKKMAKQRDQVIIQAIGTIDPKLSIKLKESADNENIEAMKMLANRLEVEQHPDGKEVYKLDGEKFLKIETEKEWKGEKVTIRFVPELIKEWADNAV